MAEFDAILKDVLRAVRPSEEENKHVLSVARKIVSRIRKRKGHFIDVIVAGSAARGTNLKGKSDVDVFILYPKDVPRDLMEREALEIGKSLSNRFELRYAEHPYVRIVVEGVEIDVVPAYRIKPGEPLLSATDRTPLHQEYVSSRLDDRLRDEVRLLKAFMKGIGVYGAEIKTEGFSGYLCELLVLHYGSFIDVLRAAARWRPPVVIDMEKHAVTTFNDPFVVVDPVDPRRNVASPVSLNSLAVFVAAAREFLREPSTTFFFPRDVPLPAEDIRRILVQRKTTYLFLISSYPSGVSPDIVWGEMKRFSKVAARRLEEYGYSIMNRGVWTDELRLIVLVFEINAKDESLVEKRRGPPVFDYEHSERFLEKHRSAFFGPYIEDGRWYVELPRETYSPEIALYKILDEYLSSSSARKHFAAALSKGYEIVSGRGIIPHYVRNRDFALWFTHFVVRRPLWLKR